MVTQPQRRARLVFGPFEVDPHAGELRKSGVRIRLPSQPFQILLYLLARAGEVVTREQLRDQIWSEGTFVDFEHSLNVAMNRLRRALGDSAETSRYIETVPARGYRFIGSMREMGSSEAPASVGPATNLVVMGAAGVSGGEKREAKAPKRYRKRSLIVASCLTAVALLAGLFLYYHRTPALTGKGAIVLADFRNTTGDPVFDGTLHQGLAVQLEESPFLSLVSEQRIGQALRLMGLPTDAQLTPELAREICERTASDAVVAGSIAPLGSQYVLGLSAKNCNGDILDEEQVQAARKEDVLNALSQIARKFRNRSGESLAAIRKHETPLAEATTPSLEALKAYSGARKAAFSTGFTTAVPLLQRSIELDPQFAMAHAFLGRIYGDVGESVLSAESTSNAYRLRDRASDPEKFFITFSYDRQVTGDLDVASM